VTQCRCDPEVVYVHLFTLATMAVCFAADFKHNNRKDKCRFFLVSNTRSGKTLSNFDSPKKEMTYAIAIVKQKLVNCTVSFENELVPLNGRISRHLWQRLAYCIFVVLCAGTMICLCCWSVQLGCFR